MVDAGDFFYNKYATGQNRIIGPDVASLAGVLTPPPGYPYFRVTGALALTGINLPFVGFAGSIYIMPTGAFTWTAAGNIAVAGTAVVSRLLEFFYNPVTSKWYPSYV